MVGLSPECALFGNLQNLRKTPIPEADMSKAIECVKFNVRVANYQRWKGRYLYFEHPLSVSSWKAAGDDGWYEYLGRPDIVMALCSYVGRDTSAGSI